MPWETPCVKCINRVLDSWTLDLGWVRPVGGIGLRLEGGEDSEVAPFLQRLHELAVSLSTRLQTLPLAPTLWDSGSALPTPGLGLVSS